MKRINDFTVNSSKRYEVSRECANPAGWIFLIVKYSSTPDTYKIIDHDFPILDIPTRIFTSRVFRIAIVTNPIMVANTDSVLPGKICIGDTSYFDKNLIEDEE